MRPLLGSEKKCAQKSHFWREKIYIKKSIWLAGSWNRFIKVWERAYPGEARSTLARPLSVRLLLGTLRLLKSTFFLDYSSLLVKGTAQNGPTVAGAVLQRAIFWCFSTNLDHLGLFLPFRTISETFGSILDRSFDQKRGLIQKKVLLSRGKVPTRRHTERGRANALLASLGHALSHTKIVRF